MFDQDHALVFLLFFQHRTSHVVCFNARKLLYECVFNALLFPSSYRPVEKPVSHHVVTQSTFSSLSILDHHTGHLPTMMLGYYSMSACLTPSDFFHRRFDLLEAYFL
jgi:hypothetical protein